MDRDDVEGAKAAAQYFIELYPYVYATGDLDEWRAMSHPECEFCATVAGDVESVFEGGGYGTGGEITIDEIRVLEPTAENPYMRVGLRVSEEPSTVYSAPGMAQSGTEGGGGFYLTALVRQADSWVVRAVSAEAVN